MDNIEVYKGWEIRWTGRSYGGINTYVGVCTSTGKRLGGTSREYVKKSIDWLIDHNDLPANLLY